MKRKNTQYFINTNTPDRGSVVVVAKSALVELLVVAVDCDTVGDLIVDIAGVAGLVAVVE